MERLMKWLAAVVGVFSDYDVNNDKLKKIKKLQKCLNKKIYEINRRNDMR